VAKHTRAKESVPIEVAKLKAQPGKNIALLGSSDLASTFIRHGLIDEYLLLANPVVLGAGQPLFKGLTERLSLKLERTQAFRSGVVVLAYTPITKSA
jgi:dihydrofolate reductase